MIFGQLLAFLLLITIPLASADTLPDLGEASQASFSPQMEKYLGESIMIQIRNDPSFINDDELTEYLNNLGNRLAAATADRLQSFEFFLINDSTINAFTLPGGVVGVHAGLVMFAQNESELAVVLSHEIAHTSQLHLARIIAKKHMWDKLANLAKLIGDIHSNAQVKNAARAIAEAIAKQDFLNYLPEYELEADRIGTQILSKAGFDTHAAVTFFERLQKVIRYNDSIAPYYVETHPITNERVADIQNRAEEIAYRQTPDNIDFHLLRAKLRAKNGNAIETMKYFEASLNEKKFVSEAAQRYGLITTLLRVKKFKQAERELATLRNSLPLNAIVESLAAQLQLAAGKPSAAVAQYRLARLNFPNRRPLIYGYVEALLNNKQSVEALKFLEEEQQLHPNDIRLLQLQAQGYSAQEKLLLSNQAMAEAYFCQGNLAAAVNQLQNGLNSGDGNFYQISAAKARLRQLRTMDRERKRQ